MLYVASKDAPSQEHTQSQPVASSGPLPAACLPPTCFCCWHKQKAAGNEAVALINAVLGNIIGIFITPAWLGLFLNVEGQAPYSKVG
jgi:predicted Na+-dependent transporter